MKSGDLFQDAADHLIAGVDEVGRGPLAGDVVAAAVILNDPPPEGVTDSKALSAGRRETLAETIRSEALCWALGRATVAEIDEMNILQASLLAMRRAVEGERRSDRTGDRRGIYSRQGPARWGDAGPA